MRTEHLGSETSSDKCFYSEGLHAAFYDPIEGLYTYNASAPLGVKAGLRQLYEFGLYSHCAYVNATAGVCSDSIVANKFTPYDAIVGDMAANYSRDTNSILTGTTFHNSNYLGEQSNAAYYLILLATICAALSLITLVNLWIAFRSFLTYLSVVF